MVKCCDPVRNCDLRHKITIQKASRTPDGGGGFAVTWVPFKSAKACVEPLRGRERLNAMQLEDSISHKVTMRYQAGITAAMRILFGTRPFNIRAVINIEERNRWLEIFADEGVAT